MPARLILLQKMGGEVHIKLDVMINPADSYSFIEKLATILKATSVVKQKEFKIEWLNLPTSTAGQQSSR
jgi:hypothetical protein